MKHILLGFLPFALGAWNDDGIVDQREGVAPEADTDGELNFALTIFEDENYNTPWIAGQSSSFVVGNTLYFKVENSHPISNVEFSLHTCDVKNSDRTLEYRIITDICPDENVSTQYNGNSYANDEIKVQYEVFEFVQDAQTSATNTIHITCQVILCDGLSTSGTDCRTGCNSRKRRSYLDYEYITVTNSFQRK